MSWKEMDPEEFATKVCEAAARMNPHHSLDTRILLGIADVKHRYPVVENHVITTAEVLIASQSHGGRCKELVASINTAAVNETVFRVSVDGLVICHTAYADTAIQRYNETVIVSET